MRPGHLPLLHVRQAPLRLREQGFTTAILHSDRDGGIEHCALHKPLHVSVAYGYRDARDRHQEVPRPVRTCASRRAIANAVSAMLALLDVGKVAGPAT